MKFFDRSRAWIEGNADLGLDLIRIYLGIGLMFKAIFFIANRGELINLMDEAGTLWFGPAIIAHYIIIAHLVGGFLLAIGLFTRAAALIQIPILLGAVFWVHMPRMLTLGMRESVEFSALMLFLLLVVFLYGAGRWSLDYFFSKPTAEEETPLEKPA
ncbi:MAG: DoxX family protein [Verrucomicrobia bacterium]|jgi:uncharacterized membrane protein YphA (DoxX/SURF4 family)|nr:DoxX family protein [Verrucomicrobiota bacterium]